ncbi:hypothetical protein DPMN_025699 [Dreissena polymorpha]|uniref:Uncharacterized protein n=1 Tax=Dreissena polymorpha TaxID=45954 RepID=A0A9D4RBW5_DREPO|nr:hypothetical protein DPMN_025699 [Dreissena polymorpha]
MRNNLIFTGVPNVDSESPDTTDNNSIATPVKTTEWYQLQWVCTDSTGSGCQTSEVAS